MSTFLRRVIYVDSQFDWNNIDQSINSMVDMGYNVVNLAFYIYSGSSPSPTPGPADAAMAWSLLTPARQLACVQRCHSKGASVLVSAGGSTEFSPYTTPARTYAQAVCQWAVANNLDGVDYDLEYIQPHFT